MKVIAVVCLFFLAAEAKIPTHEVPIPIPMPTLDIKHVEHKINTVKEVKVPVIKKVPVENTVEHIKEIPYIKNVPVPNEVKVFRDVEVVREVPVEKIIRKRVEVPVEVVREIELIREVPVVKEIPHVKIVKLIKEVPVEEIVYKDVYELETNAVKVPVHVPVITEKVEAKPSKFSSFLNFHGFLG
ncbi:mantle protein-like [Toxorhynchites rutilus septentrionalis]|uniref:mantle protein-like n=1 Tax=Toxorhynchites rutilus septentrionalis TaxID=329112 RepID=UPI00247A2EEE|nr:mantle protein-like [Toxorhynchites rutilus septentrionalis]